MADDGNRSSLNRDHSADEGRGYSAEPPTGLRKVPGGTLPQQRRREQPQNVRQLRVRELASVQPRLGSDEWGWVWRVQPRWTCRWNYHCFLEGRCPNLGWAGGAGGVHRCCVHHCCGGGCPMREVVCRPCHQRDYQRRVSHCQSSWEFSACRSVPWRKELQNEKLNKLIKNYAKINNKELKFQKSIEIAHTLHND